MDELLAHNFLGGLHHIFHGEAEFLEQGGSGGGSAVMVNAQGLAIQEETGLLDNQLLPTFGILEKTKAEAQSLLCGLGASDLISLGSFLHLCKTGMIRIPLRSL